MKSPVTQITGNLLHTNTGTVWAIYRLQGIQAGFAGTEDSMLSRLHHQALLNSLSGTEAALLGLSSDVDVTVVVRQMMAGVDASKHPAWVRECELTLQALRDNALGGREFFLVVALPAPSMKARAGSSWRATATQVRDMLALPLETLRPAAVSGWLQAAAEFQKQIPTAFEAVSASLAEMLWITARNHTRGIPALTAPPVPQDPDDLAPEKQINTRRAFPFAVVDEGARSDKAGSPVRNRVLKVTSLDTEETTYQTLLVLSNSPQRGWADNDSWFHRIDQLGVEADWCIRLTVTTAHKALQRSKKAERNLVDQADQQASSSIVASTGGAVEVGMRTLSDYVAALKATDQEYEVQATVIVALASTDRTILEDKAIHFRQDFTGIDFTWDRPLGGQEALWWMFMPGTPTARIGREYTQITTARDFSTLAPLISRDLGDNKGVLLAENQSSGKNSPVLFDPAAYVGNDRSPAIGACGEPGAGKSYFLKKVLGSMYDRGARIVVIDPTSSREYGHFATSISNPVVVDLVRPTYSLDPIRVLGRERGVGLALSLIVALTRIKQGSPEHGVMSEILASNQLNVRSLPQLMTYLDVLASSDRRDAEAARSALRQLAVFQFGQYKDLLFDQSVQALPMNARAIVFLTAGVNLPFEAELTNVNLFAEMQIEKIVGRALYALIFTLCRIICFEDENDMAVCCFDEAHTALRDPVNSGELNLWLRDGRKHSAQILLGTQNASDFGSDEIRGLILNRFVFRQTDDKLARANLEWLHEGFGADESLVGLVTKNLAPPGPNGKVPKHRRGEALYRDVRARIGRVRVLSPYEPARAEKLASTPSETTVAQWEEQLA